MGLAARAVEAALGPSRALASDGSGALGARATGVPSPMWASISGSELFRLGLEKLDASKPDAAEVLAWAQRNVLVTAGVSHEWLFPKVRRRLHPHACTPRAAAAVRATDLHMGFACLLATCGRSRRSSTTAGQAPAPRASDRASLQSSRPSTLTSSSTPASPSSMGSAQAHFRRCGLIPHRLATLTTTCHDLPL